MSKIAFLGLGVMGYPMAGHIAAAGHEVTVYNRTTARAEAWVDEHGGSHALTPAAAAAGADIVLSCVGDDPDVLQVALGPDGAIPACVKEPSISTTAPYRLMSHASWRRPAASAASARLMRPSPAARPAPRTAS